MRRKKIVIYKLMCLITNKSYIGQTNNFIKRLKGHFNSKYLIENAIRKYEIKNFKVEILWITTSKETANCIEIAAIDFYNARAPNGYNLTKGGEGGDTQSGIKRSKETKIKMRRPKSESHKLAMKIACPNRYGINNPMYGKKRIDVAERNKKDKPAKGKHWKCLKTNKKSKRTKIKMAIARIKYWLRKEMEGGD